MTDYRRCHQGRTYFFTVVTYNRQAILTEPAARQFLRESWRATGQTYPFETLGLCLMPDHLHCIWRLPAEDLDYSRRWSFIKRGFSQRWIAAGHQSLAQPESRIQKRELGVWQRRFWEHWIRNATDQANHLHYIHYNPVKHGYTKTPVEWPWSTIHKYHRQGLYNNFHWDVLDELDRSSEIEYWVE